jgi:hypothetical protein
MNATKQAEKAFLKNARMVYVPIGERHVSVPVTGRWAKVNRITGRWEFFVQTFDGWLTVNDWAHYQAVDKRVPEVEPDHFRILREGSNV